MIYLFHYKNGIIKTLENSKALCGNGVAYDSVKRLIFLAQIMKKNIQVFKYKENGDIKFIEDIYLFRI